MVILLHGFRHPRPPVFPIYPIICIGSYKGPIFQEILLYSGLLIFRRKKIKILRDFQGQIRGKIGRFRRILAEKIQISKDFQGQILRKPISLEIWGGNFAKKQSVKNSRFRCFFFFWQISLKSTQFSHQYDQRLTFF